MTQPTQQDTTPSPLTETPGTANPGTANPVPKPARAAARRQALVQSGASGGPDFVAALFDILCERKPDLTEQRPELEAAVRQHFGGSKQYITTRSAPNEVVSAVLAHFNGCNAREVARRLGISRATVYRVIKQAGQ